LIRRFRRASGVFVLVDFSEVGVFQPRRNDQTVIGKSVLKSNLDMKIRDKTR